MKTHIGIIQVTYRVRSGPLFSVEVRHEGLKKHRLFKGPAIEYVQNNAYAQASEWDNKYEELKRCWDKKSCIYAR